ISGISFQRHRWRWGATLEVDASTSRETITLFPAVAEKSVGKPNRGAAVKPSRHRFAHFECCQRIASRGRKEDDVRAARPSRFKAEKNRMPPANAAKAIVRTQSQTAGDLGRLAVGHPAGAFQPTSGARP